LHENKLQPTCGGNMQFAMNTLNIFKRQKAHPSS